MSEDSYTHSGTDSSSSGSSSGSTVSSTNKFTEVLKKQEKIGKNLEYMKFFNKVHNNKQNDFKL